MRLLILSDIHANWTSLSAIDETYDGLIFLGDIVDYGPNPVECLDFIRQNADFTVRGNHDNALGFGVDCHCSQKMHDLSVATRSWHKTLLNEDDVVFLRRMPVVKEFAFDGYRFFIAHASPKGDLFKYLSLTDLSGEIEGIDADFILIGHTHLPFVERIGKVTVVNPGSVGQPRDGDPKAAYAVFEDGEITLRRIEYDVQRTIGDLKRSPLTEMESGRLSDILKDGRT